MRFPLFLFTLIASFLLAVSPTPVPDLERPKSPGPVRKRILNAQFINDQGVKLGTEQTVFDERITSQTAFTKKLKEALGLGIQEIQSSYTGSYSPKPFQKSLMDEKWVFMNGTLDGRPWFGWIAKKDTPDKRDDPLFVGILYAKLRRVGPLDSEDLHGRPDAKVDKTCSMSQWRSLFAEFRRHFMRGSYPLAPSILDAAFTVAFLNPKGEELGNKETDFGPKTNNIQSSLTKVMYELFGRDLGKPIYKGLVLPQRFPHWSKIDREWLLIKVIGVDPCKKKPCYGYVAKGFSLSNAGNRLPSAPLVMYAAFSEGQPRWGRFIPYKRYPGPYKNAVGTKSRELVLNTISGEFEANFMGPRLPLPVGVSFIGKKLSQGPVPTIFTEQINQALGVRGGGSITYHQNSYSRQPRFSFFVVGGHKYCLLDDPCFAYGNQPANVDFHPEARRILIIQPKVRNETKPDFQDGQFDIIGTYPRHKDAKIDELVAEMRDKFRTVSEYPK